MYHNLEELLSLHLRAERALVLARTQEIESLHHTHDAEEESKVYDQDPRSLVRAVHGEPEFWEVYPRI
ncbi:uncharacterized protein BT62DRAFT_937911 [Guyanagaster necrorhizus]|uniref:Uncharacterized protein n=1 Tax=Guyanagaster necrorhizus TaxID=856835 RepID=A0A9P8AMB4_9AGAR|nr:uncharacterized protein BT62DRAFT_937911 [Guyanagaster necrorhizus MCA 3950]KAG7440511.1 hypothetical protein BT62DRAFT_937911 [Guyanagaster necrorhizus MCA 3950]